MSENRNGTVFERGRPRPNRGARSAEGQRGDNENETGAFAEAEVVSESMAIRGDIVFDGSVVIRGRVQGGVEAQGNVWVEGSVDGAVRAGGDVRVNGRALGGVDAERLHVSRGAFVGGTVSCDQVRVEGVLSGAVYADALKLMRGGVAQGEAHCNQLMAEPGSKFDATLDVAGLEAREDVEAARGDAKPEESPSKTGRPRPPKGGGNTTPFPGRNGRPMVVSDNEND